MLNIIKYFKIRTRDEVAQWAIENFNVNDVASICNSEVAREIRNLSIRISMYMEISSDCQRQATAIAVLSIMISVCALIVSTVIAILK